MVRIIKYVLFILLIIISLNSCKLNNNYKKDSCESKDYFFEKISIYNTPYNLKVFYDSKTKSYFCYKNIAGNFNTHEFYKSFDLDNLTDINEEKIVCVNFILEKQPGDTILPANINKPDISGILLYFNSEKNDDLYVKIYKNISNKFIESNFSNLRTRYISSNDIEQISKKIFNIDNFNSVSFINYKKIPNENLYQSELQKKIKKY